MMQRHILSLLLFFVIATPGVADTSIDVGTHELLPNTANQPISIFAMGDDQVRGFNLRAQIGDGMGPIVEPTFDDVDFNLGIWDAFAKTTLGGPVEESKQFAQASVAFDNLGDTVAADGLVATIMVSTIGLEEGTFDLLLSGTEIGENSDFIVVGGGTFQPTITNGTIRIVPEPTGAFGFLMCLALVIRRRL